MPVLALRGGHPVRSAPGPSWPVTGEREVELVTKVIRSGRWSFDGPWEERFSAAFAKLLGAKHVLSVANGSAGELRGKR